MKISKKQIKETAESIASHTLDNIYYEMKERGCSDLDNKTYDEVYKEVCKVLKKQLNQELKK